MKESKLKAPIVFLAGGYGRRMGSLSQTIPQFSLPIYDQPLLLHTLGYISESFDQDTPVYISTRTDLIPFLKEIVGLSTLQNVHIIDNPAHGVNVLEGFRKALEITELSQNFWLVLSDIVFIGNPFSSKQIQESHDLLLGKLETGRFLHNGGIISVQDEADLRVTGIYKIPVDNVSLGIRWSGTAFCGDSFVNSFDELLSQNPSDELSLESIFDCRLKRNKTWAIGDADFVNINTVDHYALAQVMKSYERINLEGLKTASTELQKYILDKGLQI